jgi:hypothetical protein
MATDETLQPDECISYLNHLGNYEAKLILAMLIATSPCRPLTAADLRNEFIGRQQPDPVWRPAHRNMLYTALAALHPIGAARQVKTMGSGAASNRLVNAIQAEPSQTPKVLAFCGAVLGWSLDYTDHSVQTLYGKSTGGGRQYSPEVRYLIYEHLLRCGPTLSMSLFAALGLTRYTTQSLYDQIDRLRSHHILVGGHRETPVAMTTSFVEPITDLQGRLASLGTLTYARRMAEQAPHILDQPAQVRALTHKAVRFSWTTQATDVKYGRDEPLQAKLVQIIRKLGEASVRQARDALHAEYGYTHDTAPVATALRTLHKNGSLAVSRRRGDGEPIVNRYRLAATKEVDAQTPS